MALESRHCWERNEPWGGGQMGVGEGSLNAPKAMHVPAGGSAG